LTALLHACGPSNLEVLKFKFTNIFEHLKSSVNVTVQVYYHCGMFESRAFSITGLTVWNSLSDHLHDPELRTSSVGLFIGNYTALAH